MAEVEMNKLELALEALKEQRRIWIQGTLHREVASVEIPFTQHCSLGLIEMVVKGQLGRRFHSNSEWEKDLDVICLAKTVVEMFPELFVDYKEYYQNYSDTIVHWNDAETTTYEDVVVAFEKASMKRAEVIDVE